MLRLGIPAILVALSARVLSAASPVGVYLDFGEPASSTTVAAMQKEAAAILEKVGIRIAWRLVSENQGNEPFDRLVVVKFTGKCACGGFLHPTREVLVLGSTAVASGQVLPYSEVRCDELRRLLPEIEFAADRRRGDVALGRALARVLAHELYHVLMGTTRHASSGAAKLLQSTEDLRSDEFAFEMSDWGLNQTPAAQ